MRNLAFMCPTGQPFIFSDCDNDVTKTLKRKITTATERAPTRGRPNAGGRGRNWPRNWQTRRLTQSIAAIAISEDTQAIRFTFGTRRVCGTRATT